MEGGDYTGTYGITASGNSLNLKFVTKHQYGTNIGSRVYLLESDTAYQMFKLKNQEFTFDVDMSNLPCGLNGALYFVEMAANGGLNTGNKCGAKFGTGYCDAQCPHDIKWINGEANILGWKPSPNDPNAGAGQYGACCIEMDVWEANSMATAYTPHVCTNTGLLRCNGTQCGDGSNRYGGVCDKDGCDFNSWRMGNRNYVGSGKTVDTSKPFTVVTQFLTKDNTSNGDLSEIRRLYVQGGKVIPNSQTSFTGIKPYDSVTDQFCADANPSSKTRMTSRPRVDSEPLDNQWLEDMFLYSACGTTTKLTCCGWTVTILSTNRTLNLVSPEDLVPPLLANPMMLRTTLPTPMLNSPTSSSVILDPPTLIKQWA